MRPLFVHHTYIDVKQGIKTEGWLHKYQSLSDLILWAFLN